MLSFKPIQIIIIIIYFYLYFILQYNSLTQTHSHQLSQEIEFLTSYPTHVFCWCTQCGWCTQSTHKYNHLVESLFCSTRMWSLGNFMDLRISVFIISLSFEQWQILVINELRVRPNRGVFGRSPEHRPWHPRLLFVHSTSVQKAFVLSIAQYLHINHVIPNMNLHLLVWTFESWEIVMSRNGMKNLNLVSNVDVECTRAVIISYPVTIFDYLQASYLIWNEHGERGHVGVRHHPQGQLRPGTRG